MANSHSRFVLIGLSAAVLSTAAVMATMPRVVSDSEKAEKARKVKLETAIKTLESQLQRRFHDRDNVTFGMSRVVRAEERFHRGPLAEKIGPPRGPETRTAPDGTSQAKNEFGEW